MDPSHIAELLEPFLRGDVGLTPVQLDQISTYIDLLLRWNARLNLTAIRSPEEIVTRHFGESLFAASILWGECGADTLVRDRCGAHTPVRTPQIAPPPSSSSEASAPPSARSRAPNPRVAGATADADATHNSSSSQSSGQVVDLGSGAGFPGLPIKIWSPQTGVTLIESNHKKVAFLREVIRALTLTGINVFAGRAEDFSPASACLVTLRAVERFDSTLPTAGSLVATGGRLALLIGQAQVPRVPFLAPSFEWSNLIPIPQSKQRVIMVGQK